VRGWLQHHLPGITVDAVSRRQREARRCTGLALKPERKEAGYDRVAGRELRYPVSDRLHDAGTVGHRDAAIVGRNAAGDDAQVVEVERARSDTHPDLSGFWRAGILQRDEVERLKPSGARKPQALQDVPPHRPGHVTVSSNSPGAQPLRRPEQMPRARKSLHGHPPQRQLWNADLPRAMSVEPAIREAAAYRTAASRMLQHRISAPANGSSGPFARSPKPGHLDRDPPRRHRQGQIRNASLCAKAQGNGWNATICAILQGVRSRGSRR
jgi:hypothetical protein